jgi:hypothetical protein
MLAQTLELRALLDPGEQLLPIGPIIATRPSWTSDESSNDAESPRVRRRKLCAQIDIDQYLMLSGAFL